MSTIVNTELSGKLNFPGPIGTKRRRMRSGGNTSGNNTMTPRQLDHVENVSDQKTAQISKCKGATTIPIFLKSTSGRELSRFDTRNAAASQLFRVAIFLRVEIMNFCCIMSLSLEKSDGRSHTLHVVRTQRPIRWSTPVTKASPHGT